MRFRSEFLLIILVLGVSSAPAQSSRPPQNELSQVLANLPFPMSAPELPTIPDRVVKVTDYGAVPDGQTMNTEAFARAIDACSKSGGGKVVVPPGTWLSGPITLRSNIDLHLERGALIQFSRRCEDFPVAPTPGTIRTYKCTSPLSAFKAENFAITGDGIFDGAGEAWRPVKKEKLTARQWKDLVASGGVVTPDGKMWWPSKEAMEGETTIEQLKSNKVATASDYSRAREFLRPDLVQLIQCRKVLIDGPTFQNSPKFHLHPIQSEQLVIRNVRVQCHWWAQNGDGIDLTSCRDAVVYNCTVDAGDDALCIKPGRIASTQKPGPACENIVIANSVVYSGHGGFVIGSESYGGARNIAARNCIFSGTDVGIRFKSARGRGGLVENIFIDGIQMRNIANEAILFDMYYGGDSPEVEASKGGAERRAEPVNDQTPRFQKFFVKNIVCTDAGRALLANGLPEMLIKEIRLENISITSKKGVLCRDASGFEFVNTAFMTGSGPVATLVGSSDIHFKAVHYTKDAELFLKVDGPNADKIVVEGVDLSAARKGVELGTGVKSSAVIVK